MRKNKYPQVVSMLILITAIYYSFTSIMPSQISETNAATDFSTANALHHLKEITKKPHYTGSEEHIVVRNFIVTELEKLGLQVEIQEQIAVNKKWRAATNNRNILTRIKGTENGKALLLLSHYDSNPHSALGASDAGSGVVAILEGVRAFLAKNRRAKNDIIICITDAEELGLLGANAFVNHHPWAKEVGLVLNFEARGSGGPSYMLLETNGGNKKLIEAFQKAESPYPVANSLMYSIYKMLPNDTDLTVFREDSNIDGFNFAFIGDHFDYHTAQDSFERMDLNTFEHQASYLMASLNYFANSDLENLKSETDYVYFNFPYVGLVFYPFSWVMPLFVICLVLFLILIISGVLKQRLTCIGMVKGFVPFLLSLVFSSLITFYGWKIILKIHPQYNDILHGFTYNGYFYIACFVALTLAMCFWFYKGFFKKRTLQDLLIAPLFFWILLNAGIAMYLPGAGFFILPVIVSLVILLLGIFSKTIAKTTVFFTLLTVPVLIVFAPLLKMFPVGLGLKMLGISTVFTVLLFGLLVPVFQQYKNHKQFANIFLLIGCGALISASLSASYNYERKQPNSILYVWDTNLGEAYWASYNAKTDEFTQQFLGEDPNQGSYDTNTFKSKYNTDINLHTQTAVKSLQKPLITIVSDTIVDNNRTVCLSIVSQRHANKIELLAKTPIRFKSFKVNDEALKNTTDNAYVLEVDKGTIMSYFITEENELIDLEFVVDQNQQFDVDIVEAKFDLFTNDQFEITPRTKDMIPMPFVLNDATVIKTNIKF
jgi:hypothetical protein